MEQLSEIIKPVNTEMKAFEKLYKESLQGHSSDFQSMIDYLTHTNGKKIRPLLLILSAKLCGNPNNKTIEYAVIMELLHTATIVHDDVVDDTKQRRGTPSLNARYDNRAAVLLGDYILSIAITKAVLTQNFQILRIISNLALNLVEGELSQWANSNNVIIDEERYYEIIRKKTAVLLASCTEIGAISVGVDNETIENFRLLGEYLGICFQIKDDIFDYFENGDIGKPTGNDIREGKITLPLIYALKNASEEESHKMLNIIKRKDFSEQNIQILTDFAKEKKGIEYAEKQMETFKQKASSLLNAFPESEAKSAMLHLLNYIVERNK